MTTQPASADDNTFPAWAYRPDLPDEPITSTEVKRVPGSPLQLTQAQIDNVFFVPDWYPETHPAMPAIVASGRAPAIEACGLCHLPTGAGHPESADLAGLSVAFLQSQMADYKSGARKSPITDHMVAYAKAISDEDALASAQYFAGLKRIAWTQVVEADVVPKTFMGPHGQSMLAPGGGTEPRKEPIMELCRDPDLAKLRASKLGFVAYVPVGSIAKGKALVEGAGGNSIPCAACHGPDLKGVGDIPPINARSPLYVFRSLNDMKAGVRGGDNAAPMLGIVAGLSQDDMVAIAAYLGSLGP